MTVGTPLVTVGIPTYNPAAILGRAVESVISQDYQNLELIISDNASTDSTAVVCRDFTRRDNRVRCMRQESNCTSPANFLSLLAQAQAKDPLLLIAKMVFKDIAWGSRLYRQLGMMSRFLLGAQASSAVFSRYCMPVYKKIFQRFLDSYAIWRAFERFLDRYVIWRFGRPSQGYLVLCPRTFCR
jgi:glycosyltransferase involved in cell wall biosynthesis